MDNPHHAEHFYTSQNLAKPNVFKIYVKNYCLNPVLFLVTAAIFFDEINNPKINSMQDTPTNIYAKFDSSWSSSVTEEEFWKIVNDHGQQQMPSDGNSWHGHRPGEWKKKRNIPVADPGF